MNATQQLHDLGQSLWLDNITRALLTYSFKKICAPMYGSARKRIARAFNFGIAERCFGKMRQNQER